MTFEIRKAQRQGARLLIQLSGVSGSGKTYTALQLAYGLAGRDADKVVLIDTENRRGSLYANALPQPFNIIDFYAPFSPARYIQAIEAACNAGAEVVVIDSVTHEWESEGGCEWIANQTRFPDWKRAKAEHKRFMTYMLQSPAHIIACTRAREKVDFTDPKNPRPLGIQPIQEKNFSYEATVSLMMHEQGRRQDVLKCPAELQQVLGRGQGYLGADDGLALRHWVDGAAKVNPAIEHHRGLLLNITEQGLQALQAAWMATPANVRKALGDKFKDQLKAAAAEYDAQRQAVHPSAPASIQEINNQKFVADDAAPSFDHMGKSEQNANAVNNTGVF
jgi:energy-coupling factor transporter ATP-binding protein EcfA2